MHLPSDHSSITCAPSVAQVMLLCFASFHMRMAALNETTIEGPSPAFHVGLRRNWEQVFGTNPWLWLLPVWGGGPAGDGVHWPTRERRILEYQGMLAEEEQEGLGEIDLADLADGGYYDDDMADVEEARPEAALLAPGAHHTYPSSGSDEDNGPGPAYGGYVEPLR